ncbi:MAG: hypothetical protein KC646_04845 [Candidatus Cloacimonetes bacterium]|nr:hypothetical protein [Candidatus Cloacimonadota bacterium]
MFKKALIWSFLLLIGSELVLNIFYFTTRFRPQQSQLKVAMAKIAMSNPVRSIYCIGDGFTSGYGATSGMSYPNYLQILIDSDSQYKGLKVINLGFKNSTIDDHLQIIAKMRPESRIILRSRLGHLIYSKAQEGSTINSLQIVKLVRKLLSYPSVSMSNLEKLYYLKTLNLMKQKHHRPIYFNYTHLDRFMNHFNLDSFHISHEMKEPQNKYSYISVSKKYLSVHSPFLNSIGYSLEAKLLFEHIKTQGYFLQQN